MNASESSPASMVAALAKLTEKIARADRDGAADARQLAEALRRRGALLLSMGDKRGAEADARRAMELCPEAFAVDGNFEARGTE